MFRLPDLDKYLTYIFELVSPETQVVIKYSNACLYHIGTRNNITGTEYYLGIGIEKPKEYPLRNLDDCIKASIKLTNPMTDKFIKSKKKALL